MISKTITFAGYDGKLHTREYHFHLNKAELTELGVSHNGGMDVYIKRIIAAEDVAAILVTLREFVAKAVGKPSEDGVQFVKQDKDGNEYWLEFIQSEAWSELFVELVGDPVYMAKFLVGILPKDMQDEIEKNQNQLELPADDVKAQNEPAKPPTFDDYTQDDLLEMPSDEFNSLMKNAKGNVPATVLQIAMQRKFFA